MDYSKGKIYKIIDESNGDVYVGSTIQDFHTRFRNHHIFKGYNKIKSNCKISLIEDYPCNNKRELEEREQYWMDKIDCINKLRSLTNYDTKKKEANEKAKKSYHEKLKYDETWIEEHRSDMKKRREYQNTWGGRIDNTNNSLLKIDPDLFT